MRHNPQNMRTVVIRQLNLPYSNFCPLAKTFQEVKGILSRCKTAMNLQGYFLNADKEMEYPNMNIILG
jgi:hypothetical protein